MNLKIYAKTIENEAVSQVNALASLDTFADAKIRIMPDAHSGASCVIGFTADLGKRVIPNIVGVDIGCGMLVVELGKMIIDFENFDEVVKQNVPSGFSVHNKDNDSAIEIINKVYCFDKLQNTERLYKSMGTLGGGNHFIEVDEDNEGNKYLVIHTGSRNFGLQIAKIYQDMAIALHPELPKDFAYLEGEYREAYLHDMACAQQFASYNRHTIVNNILSGLGLELFDFKKFEVIHNYISFNDNIIRKGAISANKGERVLIPLNMKDGSILGYGKGNDDWNCSAPHGAGRLMSRVEAKRILDVEQFKEQMKGIYSTTVCAATLDEAPGAYKPMEEIIEAIRDTVEVEKVIKPIYNFKAVE